MGKSLTADPSQLGGGCLTAPSFARGSAGVRPSRRARALHVTDASDRMGSLAPLLLPVTPPLLIPHPAVDEKATRRRAVNPREIKAWGSAGERPTGETLTNSTDRRQAPQLFVRHTRGLPFALSVANPLRSFLRVSPRTTPTPERTKERNRTCRRTLHHSSA